MTGSAKSTIAWSEGSSVQGVLFDIAPFDLPLLNTKEGGYAVRKVVVEIGGVDVSAWTYVAAPVRTSLRQFTWYVDLIVAGARHHGVSGDYIKLIADAPQVPDSDLARVAEAERCIQELRGSDPPPTTAEQVPMGTPETPAREPQP